MLFLSRERNDTASVFRLLVCTLGLGQRLHSLGLPRPLNVSNMFVRWLDGLRKDLKPLVLLGAAAMCWSLWLCRNAVIFENKQPSFLQVIYSTTHWLRTWPILQKPTSHEVVVAASQSLAQVAKEFFTRAHGWRSSLRIESH